MPENTASVPKTHGHSGDSNQTPGLCSQPQPMCTGMAENVEFINNVMCQNKASIRPQNLSLATV